MLTQQFILRTTITTFCVIKCTEHVRNPNVGSLELESLYSDTEVKHTCCVYETIRCAEPLKSSLKAYVPEGTVSAAQSATAYPLIPFWAKMEDS